MVDWNIVTFGVFLAIGLLVIAWRLPVSICVSFRIPTTNTNIEIEFEDLFAIDGHIAIPVNEFFDGHLGKYVDPASVHGQFITHFFQADSDRFLSQVDNVLDENSSLRKQRSVARDKCYPIGTTAVLDIGKHKAFLFALSETDLGTAKAHASIPMMWEALEGLWNTVREFSSGAPINIPLVGGGQSHVGLEPAHLIRIILLSVLLATRVKEITKKIRIVLHADMIDRVDLNEIRREWS